MELILSQITPAKDVSLASITLFVSTLSCERSWAHYLKDFQLLRFRQAHWSSSTPSMSTTGKLCAPLTHCLGAPRDYIDLQYSNKII